jgi:hypothetical protein
VYKLIQIEDIKKLTKGDFGAEFDFLLGDVIIPAVGKLFAQYCKRPDFDKAVRTEYLSPHCGRRKLFVKSPPISPAVVSPAIEALRLYQDSSYPRVYGAGTELVNGTDFIVFEDEGVIERAGYGFFYDGPKTVKVTYTGGFLTTDAVGCPEDLRLAAVAQTKMFFDRREELGLTGRSLEGGSINLMTPLLLPKLVTIMLDPYTVYVSE